jgi:hypothetical protein
MDRVRESMGVGLLRECDPEGLGVTLWAHAHGLISLYLRGSLEMSEAEFRALYRSSGLRILQGVGNPEWLKANTPPMDPGGSRSSGGGEDDAEASQPPLRTRLDRVS